MRTANFKLVVFTSINWCLGSLQRKADGNVNLAEQIWLILKCLAQLYVCELHREAACQ